MRYDPSFSRCWQFSVIVFSWSIIFRSCKFSALAILMKKTWRRTFPRGPTTSPHIVRLGKDTAAECALMHGEELSLSKQACVKKLTL